MSNGIIQAPIEFTNRDYTSIKAAIETEIRNQFPDWSNFQVAAFGNILGIQLTAHVFDVLDFLLNNQINECFIATVRERENLIGLLELIGVTLLSAAAATAPLQFDLPNGSIANDLIIPKATVVRTLDAVDPLEFRTLADVTILAGATQGLVDAENAREVVEPISTDGTANQQFLLQRAPFLDNSAVVEISGTFAEVTTFVQSAASDKVFLIRVNSQDRGLLRFGDGVNGQPPTGAGTATYKTGGGARGNIGPNRINQLVSVLTDIIGNSVTVTVTNPLSASGGTDRETRDQGKVRGPKSFRSKDVTITEDDYENHALEVAGVERVGVFTNETDSAIQVNKVVLILIPTGGGLPTGTLKTAVLTQVTVTKPNTLTTQVEVVDPIFTVINVIAKVFLGGPTVSAATVKADIEGALAAFFSPINADGSKNTQIDFGNTLGTVEIPQSNLISLIEEVQGVRKVDVPTFLPGADVVITFREFPTLGNVTLTNGDTGGPL